MRATADDLRAAELMGIDHRHIYAIAMGIALGTVALAGVFFGMRTTFAPSDGPVRLIFAFEAVIIGGLGSLWGTLVGGDRPRRRADRRHADRFQRRASLPAGAASSPATSSSSPCWRCGPPVCSLDR